MYKITTLYIAILFTVLACNNEKTNISQKYLNIDNLTTQAFFVNTKKDTTLITKQGVIIKIAAYSIKSNGDNVTLEVKEALSLYDIIRAGLTTGSEQGILSSDGMFYINTKESSIIKKPLLISVPTVFTDDSMQLYKGEDVNGKIVWKGPKNIQKITAPNNGKTLFETQCSSCHAIDKQLTGPALAWVNKRSPDNQALHAFIKNNQKVLASGEPYYNCLYCKYNKTPMNVFEYSLSDKDIDEIIYYLAEASKRSGVPEDANPISECDSCEKYYQLYHSLIVARDSIVKVNGKEVEVQIVPPKDSDPNADNGIIPTKVDPPQYNAEYYRFEVTGYGWYNIDDLVQGRFGSVRSSLSVILKENHTERINIFLIIPSLKIFQQGGYLEDLESLGFYDINGEIFLPQNVTAFVIGVSEYDGKLYYGQTQFFTSLHQKINLSLNETTKEMMMHSLQFLKFNNLNLKIDTTKNFSSIKAIDDELKKIGLKNAGCDCNNSDTTNDIE